MAALHCASKRLITAGSKLAGPAMTLALALAGAGCSGGAGQTPGPDGGAGDMRQSQNPPGPTFTVETVEADRPGLETGMLVDAQGAPHLFYFAPSDIQRPCQVSGSLTMYRPFDVWHAARQPSGTWTKLLVDRTAEPNGFGLALGPDGKPAVTFQGGHQADGTDSPAGNFCGGGDLLLGRLPGAAWTVSPVARTSTAGTTVVDTAGNTVGRWSALAVTSTGLFYTAFQDAHFFIADRDIPNADMEFGSGQGGAGWQFGTGGAGGEQIANMGAGTGTTLALDAQERPVVAFTSEGNGGVTVMRRDTPGKWSTLLRIGAPMSKQTRASIAVAPKSKRLGLAYHDQSNKLLALTESSDGGATWTPYEIVDKDGDCGAYVSLRYDQNDQPIIAYYNAGDYSSPNPAATDSVRVARRSAADPTVFAVSDIDTGGSYACGAYVSLGLLPGGKAVIGYQCNVPGATPGSARTTVKYAYQN